MLSREGFSEIRQRKVTRGARWIGLYADSIGYECNRQPLEVDRSGISSAKGIESTRYITRLHISVPR